jgi:predicted dehydrogenase
MITAIMIGAGNRGIGAYGAFAEKNPEDIKFVGIADPDPMRRGYFAMKHGIPADRQYDGFESILQTDKFADACFICTQDSMHFVPARLAMEKKYHIFLEKPMAITPLECIRLGELADSHGVRLMIGHVLRYTQFFSAIKSIIDSGKIGELMSIQHNENVSYWHQAHSYVRGNWGNTEKSCPMLLAKSCHDLDILTWFAGSDPLQVSSFGSLAYFNQDHAPKGAPKYCQDGCPHQDTCVYYAPKVYLNAEDWMKLPVSNDMSDQGLLKALKSGPYGRCVYQADNDAVDHQVVIIEFENRLTASFTMTAFTHENTRTIKIMGTKGEIRGHMEKNILEIYEFGNDTPETMNLQIMEYGHGGGDYGIMKAFKALIEKGDLADIASDKASIQSHLLAFAAEKSRLTHQTINFKAYLRDLRG